MKRPEPRPDIEEQPEECSLHQRQVSSGGKKAMAARHGGGSIQRPGPEMSKFLTILAIAAATLVGSSALFVWSEIRNARLIPEPAPFAQALDEPAAVFNDGWFSRPEGRAEPPLDLRQAPLPPEPRERHQRG